MKYDIEQLIRKALEKLNLPVPKIQIDAAKDKQHGDYACNIALVLAKSMQCKPRDVADKIVAALPSSALLHKIEIAGPGFINFFLAKEAFLHVIPAILTAKERYGHSSYGQGQRVIVEFVSSNPTGPLHVGHGRHGAYGAVIADLLETVGFNVHREYYVNDAGRQMNILAVSVYTRYLELCGYHFPFPANGYKGDYIMEIAQKLYDQIQKTFLNIADDFAKDLPLDEPEGGDKEIYIDALIERLQLLLGEKNFNRVVDITLENILADIRNDLAEFGVHFQEWFSEREFVASDAVDRNIKALQDAGLLYEREGALWFRSTDLGDEKDRVMQRSNGQRTYFANDFAYHIHKFERGFEHAIDIFGSDHHGYIPRMKAGLQARGISPENLTYLLVQFVTLYRSGEQVQMSTRSGSFVTLRELRAEVGNDAARFFYVMRKAEQHMDFDLDLAKAETNENPVYYIQYAYARICSVFRQLADKKMHFTCVLEVESLKILQESHELALLNTLSTYPEVIMNAAKQKEPHLLTHYLRNLANDFHTYYNSHQFLVSDENLRNARLTLITATRQVLANGLKLIGVSTPETM